MRICQVIDRLDGGGQERVAVEFSTLIRTHVEHTAVLATRAGGDYEQVLRTAGVPYFLGERRGRGDLTAWWRILKWLRQQRFDVVHVHSGGSLAAMVILRLLSRESFKIVSHLQMWPPKGRWRSTVARYYRLFRGQIHTALATNEGLAASLIEDFGFAPNKVQVMFNPVSFPSEATLEEIGRARRSKRGPLTVIMVAQWRAQKDHLTLVRAMSQLEKKHVNVECLLVGERNPLLEDAVLRECARLEVRSVKILGRRTDVRDLLTISDVAVLSTHFEGLPVSLLEYAAAGLPIVVSAVEGTDFLVDERHGVLGVAPRDPPALARAIESMLEDSARREHAGRAAFNHFRSLADAPRIRDRILGIYEAAVPGRAWSH